jgi:two-component system sensor histidine kinase PilS (NtrC family)
MSEGEAASPDRAPSPVPVSRVAAPVPTTPPPESLDAAPRRRLQAFIGVRLLVGLLLLGGALAVESSSGGSTALQQLIVVVFASSLGFALWLALGPRRLDVLAGALVSLDLLLASGLVYLTGGALSGFSFLYGGVVLGAAIVLGPRPTLVAAGAAPILYLTISLGLANGWFPLPPGTPDDLYVRTDSEFALALLRNSVGLLLVGGLAAVLSDRLHRTTGALVRATESALENARLTEDIVRSLGSGLVTTDLDDVVRSINDAGARMLDRSADELIGQRLDALFADVAASPGARSETSARRPDGTSIPVGYSRQPLVTHDGQVRGALVLFQDLSELVRLRDKAERAERLAVLGQLAAGLAHEIRNPLGAISGSVELVRDAEALGAEDRKLLGTVLAEVDRLNELVGTMLEVGKPSHPERRQVDLAEIARGVVELARRHPAAASAKVVLDAPSPVQALVDPAQLRQVLWNLVKNAVQFSPKGGEVCVGVQATDAGRVQLSVSDQGPGIPATDLPRVFDAFFTKRKHGVGLGLAVAKQIVDAHGGTIQVSSAPGRTTFTIDLDAERASDPIGSHANGG